MDDDSGAEDEAAGEDRPPTGGRRRPLAERKNAPRGGPTARGSKANEGRGKKTFWQRLRG
jgi:hypothetical protein